MYNAGNSATDGDPTLPVRVYTGGRRCTILATPQTGGAI